MPTLKTKCRCSRCHEGWAYPTNVYAMITERLRAEGIHHLCSDCMELALAKLEQGLSEKHLPSS